MTTQPALPLCDPHFHLWNVQQRPNPNLGEAVNANLPVYEAADYERDMATLPGALELVSGLHVETVVGQMEGGFGIDSVAETEWVCRQVDGTGSKRPFGLVVYAHLERDPTALDQLLQRHTDVSDGRLRGVRMILNHHPHDANLTWPQVENGLFLRNPRWRQGLAVLAERNLSFDLSCHPHQVDDAVDALTAVPSLRVIVNHLGFLHDGEDQAHEDRWRQGMQALAQQPNVFIKLSMLWFARDGYHQDAAKQAYIRERVDEVIEIFGCNRCMFASNYPVDKVSGIDMATLYGQFLEWSASRPVADRKALFHDTAVKAYNMSS